MTTDPFAAMDEVQARRARDVPDLREQRMTIARVVQTAVMLRYADDPRAFAEHLEALMAAVDDWAEANPESAARLVRHNENGESE